MIFWNPIHVFPRWADHPLPGSPSFTQASKNILGTIYNFTRIIFCRITRKLYTTKSVYGLFLVIMKKIEHFTLRITHYIPHVCLPDAKRKEKVVTGNTNALRASAPGLPCQERNYLSSVSSKILSPLSAEGTSLQS